MDGFGEKSYQKIIDSIEESRNTTFARYVVAMDIPMVGRTASHELEKYFRGDLRAFEEAATTKFEIEAPDGAQVHSTKHRVDIFHAASRFRRGTQQKYSRVVREAGECLDVQVTAEKIKNQKI